MTTNEAFEIAEKAFRHGILSALTVARDLVHGGATAADLERLRDLALDWQWGSEIHPAYIKELIEAWRAGARGVKSLDLRPPHGQQGQ